MPKSFLNNHIVRGLRNNNPGNLVKTTIDWQGKILNGKDTKFEQFQSLSFGIRAFLKDVINDINKGKNTVTKLITEYAPKHENDTKMYINSVSKTLGVTPNEVLKTIDTVFLVNLSRAIFKVELGNAHKDITNDDIITAIGMLGNITTQNLILNLKKK